MEHGHGATPYIPFKSNSKARGNGSIWKKMYYLVMLKNDEFWSIITSGAMLKAPFRW